MKPKYTTFTGIKAEEIHMQLSAKFPPEAYKGVPGGADLTDINTGFMIERVTAVFGPKGLGWNLLYNPGDLVSGGESGRTVTRLSATFLYSLWDESGARLDCAFPVSGVNQNDFKYADEGARTSAIGAAIKWLCFQNDVYKGAFDHHDAEKEKQAAARAAGQPAGGSGSATRAPAPAAPAGNPDDNEPAPANWNGVTMYQKLAEEAQALTKAGKLSVKIESVVPGTDTKGKVRQMYGALKTAVDAAKGVVQPQA